MTNKEFIESVALPGEEWRDVVGYEGYYMVSSFGRVCSLQRRFNVGNGGWRISPQKLLKPYPSQVGNYTRYCVSLWKNNTLSQKKLHRVVAETFIPNPENYSEIDHIDTDTSNNSVTNLKWCTRLLNANNPITRETARRVRVGKPMPKLRKPIVQVRNGILVNTFCCIKDVAKMGFSKSSVSSCCNKKRAQHKGYQWMFLSDYEKLTNKSKNS